MSITSFYFVLLSGVSLFTFAASIVSIPFIIGKMPEDYFLGTTRGFLHRLPNPLRLFVMVIKNIVGFLLLTAGIIMLFIPGQGLLTMVVGIALMNFPGKRKLELAFLSLKKIRHALNWIRKRKGMTEFKFPNP